MHNMQETTFKEKITCSQRQTSAIPLHLGKLWSSSKFNASPEFCSSVLAKTQGEQCHYRAQRAMWHLKSATGSQKSGSISVVGTHRCLYECVCLCLYFYFKLLFPPPGAITTLTSEHCPAPHLCLRREGNCVEKRAQWKKIIFSVC